MYNNWMYLLAGYITEILGEKPWEELIAEYYFRPIGMQEATFADRTDYTANFALPGIKAKHSNSWETVHSVDLKNIGASAWAAGGICASADDMLKYLVFLLRDHDMPTDRISRSNIRETQAPVAVWNGMVRMEKPNDPVHLLDSSYGMGWASGIYRGKFNFCLYYQVVSA